MTIMADIEARIAQGRADGLRPMILHISPGALSGLNACCGVKATDTPIFRYGNLPIMEDHDIKGWEIEFVR